LSSSVNKMKTCKPRNLYDTLGLTLDATAYQINYARKKMLYQLHPDKQGLKEHKRSEEEIKNVRYVIDSACEILLNEEMRQKYDLLLDMKIYSHHGAIDTDFNQLQEAISQIDPTQVVTKRPPPPPQAAAAARSHLRQVRKVPVKRQNEEQVNLRRKLYEFYCRNPSLI